jgi:hypothetical protein
MGILGVLSRVVLEQTSGKVCAGECRGIQDRDAQLHGGLETATGRAEE